MPNSPTPVMIRGEHYPSAKAAAHALGVHRCRVYNSLNAGRPDSIGRGRSYCPPENRRGGSPKEVSIGGVHFESRSAADRALGLSRGRTSHMLTRAPAAQRLEFIASVMKFQAEQEARARKAAEREASHE